VDNLKRVGLGRKQAFSLIELIMSIVIISIAFLTLLVIIENTTKTTKWLQNSTILANTLEKIQTLRDKNWANTDGLNIEYIDLIDGNLSVGTISVGNSDIKEIKVRGSIGEYRYYKTNITSLPAFVKSNF
jgi:prepilin-type N-terminal cleavage/methylation domain-containing protein